MHLLNGRWGCLPRRTTTVAMHQVGIRAPLKKILDGTSADGAQARGFEMIASHHGSAASGNEEQELRLGS